MYRLFYVIEILIKCMECSEDLCMIGVDISVVGISIVYKIGCIFWGVYYWVES